MSDQRKGGSVAHPAGVESRSSATTAAVRESLMFFDGATSAKKQGTNQGGAVRPPLDISSERFYPLRRREINARIPTSAPLVNLQRHPHVPSFGNTASLGHSWNGPLAGISQQLKAHSTRGRNSGDRLHEQASGDSPLPVAILLLNWGRERSIESLKVPARSRNRETRGGGTA